MATQVQKFYVNADGVYAGSFVGVDPDNYGLIEVAEAPTSSKQLWDFEIGVWSSPLPTQDDYTKAIQATLDNAATARRYDSAATMATYTNSTNSDWSAEATAMVAWRDAVWLYAYQQLDAVLAGEREQPTIEGLLAELPEPNWPDAE
nr:hypothetical protein [uncultured Cohaesibacter sp.]